MLCTGLGGGGLLGRRLSGWHECALSGRACLAPRRWFRGPVRGGGGGSGRQAEPGSSGRGGLVGMISLERPAIFSLLRVVGGGWPWGCGGAHCLSQHAARGTPTAALSRHTPDAARLPSRALGKRGTAGRARGGERSHQRLPQALPAWHWLCSFQSSGTAADNDPLGPLPSGWGKYFKLQCSRLWALNANPAFDVNLPTFLSRALRESLLEFLIHPFSFHLWGKVGRGKLLMSPACLGDP